MLYCQNNDEEFDGWHLLVTFESVPFKMLCWPEDFGCKHIENGIHYPNECCDACEMPCCKECTQHIFGDGPSMPPSSLANDMMIYYAPTELYTENVTVMEMLCASVCITSMICFALEQKGIEVVVAWMNSCMEVNTAWLHEVMLLRFHYHGKIC